VTTDAVWMSASSHLASINQLTGSDPMAVLAPVSWLAAAKLTDGKGSDGN
jgi:hypothetical protein